jgi:hypothetical protein
VTEPSPAYSGVITLSHAALGAPEELGVLANNGGLAAISGHTHAFSIGEYEGVTTAVAATATRQSWLLVSVDGTVVEFAECEGNECTPRAP